MIDTHPLIERLQHASGIADLGIFADLFGEAVNMITEQANLLDFINDHIDDLGNFRHLCERWENGNVPDQYLTHQGDGSGAL